MIPYGRFVVALGLSVGGKVAALDYLQEVKPLLTEHCVSCHNETQRKSGLRLDTAAAARLGGDHGTALIPGQADHSLLVQVLEGSHDDLAVMPYKKPPLSSAEIGLIRRWIDEGASAPNQEQLGVKLHWSFIAPTRQPLPAVSHSSWPLNPVDPFVLARLEQTGLPPSPEADPVTLLRRVTLDLTGIPPSVPEVETFLADRRPDAYERAVERLLASPHYGERWGRHWLDLARYADSNGYSIDAPRSIWPWRDWVIAALNADQPFDAFVIDQLAGDLLPPSGGAAGDLLSQQRRIATGFHRNTQINEEGGIDPEQFRIEAVIDRINTTGTTLLGLTVGCAQCHDHKFDPLSQREYFQLFAFFNNQDEPSLEAGTPEAVATREVIRTATKALQEELEARAAVLKPEFPIWESALTPQTREVLPLEVRNVLGLRPEQRTDKQRTIAWQGFFNTDPTYQALQRRLKDAQGGAQKIPTTLVLAERQEPRQSFVFIKGDFTRRGDDVFAGTPAVLPPLKGSSDGGPPNRLDLARWLVDPAHPLTARVLVNRVWQQYFGRGLVETENDFGTQGIPPTHPDLLDWLALEFMSPSGTMPPASYESVPARTEPTPGWSWKHLHRLIVTSATYRQSSRARPDLLEKDPTNRLLARQNRLRLDAEIVRDVALTTSGRLNPAMGGPGVFPPQPDGVMALGQSRREWKPSASGDRFRRGLYTYFWRATPHPALAIFDAPDAFSSCTRRLRSNTPLQALTLLNDEAFVELAEALADRVLSESPEPQRLDHAFRLCLARPPHASERERLQSLLEQERHEGDERTAWITVARVLLNLDETITRE